MVDHGGHHAPEADVEPCLHGYQHDGEDDADDRRDESKPVMKQVSVREPELQQRHVRLSEFLPHFICFNGVCLRRLQH
jgi:hypothetical protein